MDNTITISIQELIQSILGDDHSGLMCVAIPKTVATVLDFKLKGSLKWKVEFFDRDGKERNRPILWRYSEWQVHEDRYISQKLYAEKERVARWILNANVDKLARAISRETRMSIEMATPIAYSVIKKGNMEVIQYLGVMKLIEKEEEL